MPLWRPSAWGGWDWLSLEEGTSMTGQVVWHPRDWGHIPLWVLLLLTWWPSQKDNDLQPSQAGYTWESIFPPSHSESMHTLIDDPEGQCGRAERMWTVKGVRPRPESRLCCFSISPSFLSILPLFFCFFPLLAFPLLPPLIPSIHSPNIDWVVMLVCAKCWGYSGDQGRHTIPSLMGPVVERLLNSYYKGCVCV